MSYNAFGQTLGISVGNVPLASYNYAPNGGALQSMSYGNGDSVNYSYDPRFQYPSNPFSVFIESLLRTPSLFAIIDRIMEANAIMMDNTVCRDM